MKFSSIIIVIFLIISCENNKQKDLGQKDKVYLVFRDSESKEGYFAKKFNSDKNSNVSHVGILYFRNDWYVLHADNLKGNCIQNIPLSKFRVIKNKEMDLKLLEI